MDILLIGVLVILAGAGTSIQAGVNAQLQVHWARSPLLASCVSFAVGTLGLASLVLFTGTPIPALPETIVPWHWTGGFLGAFLVTITVIAAPRLGAATMIALILTGQISASLVLDHFGALGYAQKDINLQRLAGVALLGLGVYLIRKE